MSSDELEVMTLEQLQSFADQVGIGYARLDEEKLRKKIRAEAH